MWWDDNHLFAYQYNFYPEDPYIQDEGNIYWLAVKYHEGDDFTFGWKTADPDLRWGDDATYFDPTQGIWLPLTARSKSA